MWDITRKDRLHEAAVRHESATPRELEEIYKLYRRALSCPELRLRISDFCKSNSSDVLGSLWGKLTAESSGV